MKKNEFYCVSCMKKVTVHPDDITVTKLRTGTPRMKGYDKYGHKVSKFIKEQDYAKLKKQYK